MRCDAAEQLEALAAEFQKEFGKRLAITDSYRTYESQVRLKAIKPYLAAVPGTSQHGWGLAIDVGGTVPSGTSAEYVWLRTHGPDYGWDNPTWARPGGIKPEPWHFEFFGAGPMPDRYTPGEIDVVPTTPRPRRTRSRCRRPAPRPSRLPARARRRSPRRRTRSRTRSRPRRRRSHRRTRRSRHGPDRRPSRTRPEHPAEQVTLSTAGRTAR
ncbi:M15 family metallopeptidase, partial [Cellulosimicrobium sp. CUA-896]|uniref:M15 family metallopeptidase n=1 Tax=Cellulosimicrobium sp. CUA-896 TaxID=1517881 RepID=UPI0035178838